MEKSKIATPAYDVYTPQKALALLMNTNLTKENYNKIQRGAKALKANIYPSYSVVAAIKKLCYSHNIFVLESEARVLIQSLLDHTVDRLFEVQLESFSATLTREIRRS